ncbi:MAG: glycosyltransferase family 2 protein [Adhaeribacter sp.]
MPAWTWNTPNLLRNHAFPLNKYPPSFSRSIHPFQALSDMELKQLVPEFAEKFYKFFKQRAILRTPDEVLPPEIYVQNHFLKISFCITCMNRLFQLKQTIFKNLQDNESYPNCEFIIVNYHSQDGLHEWVEKHLQPEIEIGRIKYYHTKEAAGWHAAHAKNLAHFLSTGDIVCNLDGDNFTGKDFAFYINYLYQQKAGKDLLLNFRKDKYYGTYGRICLSRKAFTHLGGYDEDLHAIGGEDTDLVERGIAYQLEYQQIEKENFLKYIENTNEERVKNTTLSHSFAYYNKINMERTRQRVAELDLIANKGKVKKVTLYKNLSPLPEEIVYLAPEQVAVNY